MTQKIIDIISTGSACPPDHLKKSCAYIREKGFLPRTSTVFFSEHPLYICHDEQRLLNLKEALYAEDSDMIWCLRGGCGTSRLLPSLLSLKPPKKKKALIGFSDVTSLHFFLTQYWGWQTIHGPTLNSLITSKGQSDSVISTLDHLLQDGTALINLPLVPLNEKATLESNLQGLLSGGNLALTQRSMSTPWQVDSTGKILFFEDVNELPYRVAETLDHLKHGGLFKNVKAVIFGQITNDTPDKNEKELLKHILSDFAEKAGFPVFSDLAVGHTNNNHPLQLNTPATIISKKGLFSLQQTLTL